LSSNQHLRSGANEDIDKYPAPPTFEPLETKRIDTQIGLLRDYYHQRVAKLAPPPRPITPQIIAPVPVVPKPPTPEPPPVVIEPSAPPNTTAREPTPLPAPLFDPYNPSALSIVVPKTASALTAASTSPVVVPPILASVATADGASDSPSKGLPLAIASNAGGLTFDTIMMTPVVELPPVLEDDAPDPSRVKVGPLGQIHVPSAATVAKQKRQNKAAAQAKALAAAAAATLANNPQMTPIIAAQQSPVTVIKPKKPSPKKPKKLEAAPPTATV
jgi:transcriptional activator SPT7